MANKKEIPREISIWINDVQVVNSFAGINRAIAATNNEIKNLNKNSATYDADLKKLQTTLGGLKEKQAEFKEEIQATSVSAGEARENLSKIFLGLTSGNMALAKEGLDGVNGSIKGMVQSALAFIATPIGAAIAALTGIAVAAKSIFDFNVEAEKAAVLIENLSGKTGQVVEDIRVKMQALTDTFDLSFEQLANAVDNLVDTGVAKNELEALDKIKKGLLTAPDKNEFISSLESSAVTAKQLGMDLETVIALKQQIEATGVNPESTFGALEKATQRLSIGADGLRKKMTDAFGAAFTDETLAKVTSGEITIVQALELIDKKSKEVSLNQTQQAELGKELFGKGSVAAGGYATVLDTVAEAMKKQSEPLNENQKALDNLEAANLRVGKAQSELFRVKDFGSIWTNIKATVINAISGVLESLRAIKTFTYALSVFVQNAFISIKNSIIDAVQAIVDFIEPALSAVGVNVDKLQKKLDSFKSKKVSLNFESTTSGTSENNSEANVTKKTQEELDKQAAIREKARQKEIDAHQKELERKKAEEEKYQKSLIERAQALMKAKIDLAKAELDYFIATERSKLEGVKELTPEIISAETKRLEEIKFRQQNAAAEKRLVDIAKAETEAKSAEELAALKSAIDLQYLTTTQNLEFAFMESTAAMKKQYTDQQNLLKLEQIQLQNNLELLEADTALERKQIQLKQDYEEEIANYKKLFENKRLTRDQFDRFLAAADKKYASAEKAIKSQQVKWTELTENQKLDAIKGALNGAAEALNKGSSAWKAVKIAETSIATYQSAVNSYNSLSGITVVGPVLGAIAAAAAVASGIAQIRNIAKTKIETAPKYFYGGFANKDKAGGPTGSAAALGNDEFGEMTGVTHKDEWVAPAVMTQNPRYAATFTWLENERKRVVANKYFDGGETTAGSIPKFENSGSSNDQLISALNKLNAHLDKGIISYPLIGYEEARKISELNDERTASSSYGTVNRKP